MTAHVVASRDAEALAHELRTPLAVIAGYAELVASRGDERTCREAAARISEAVERMNAILDDLVGAERLTSRSGG